MSEDTKTELEAYDEIIAIERQFNEWLATTRHLDPPAAIFLRRDPKTGIQFNGCGMPHSVLKMLGTAISSIADRLEEFDS